MADGSDYYDPYHEIDSGRAYPPDPKVAEARKELGGFFEENREEVFYSRQLEVLFERTFFHWITVKALGELNEAGEISSDVRELSPNVPIRFYWHRRNRYWKRKAGKIAELVRLFSRTELGLGRHAEVMFTEGLAMEGFVPRGRDVNAWNNRVWERSGHDLDRVFERDGVAYGAEIKNTLPYIDREELDIKLEMCAWLGLRPLFIMRASPKSYNYQIIRRGGYVMIFGAQLYPFGHDTLVERVRAELGLPVNSPRAIPGGTLQRFVAWHGKTAATHGL